MDLPGRGGKRRTTEEIHGCSEGGGLALEQAVRNKVREVPLRRLLKWSHERRGKEMLTYMLV